MKKINRQAVVVIHGMGEQRPMNTLREFVDGVKWQMEQLDPTEKKVKVRSKADSVGDIYETVRLSMESNFKSRRPITDFYEFYWAHNMRGNTFGTASTWLKHVVFKWPGQIPPHLRHLWWKVWTIFIIAGLTALAISFLFQTTPLVKTVIAISSGALVSFIIGLMGSFVKNSFLNSLGDVARYFTPDPDNIGERSNIRQQGIAFLKKLHDISNITKPDRIIVVAHSLGSAVAYDFIRLLWAEYGPVYKSLPKEKQEALDRVNVFAQAPDTITGNYEAFADAQHDCWQECNAMGNPWLITDFITLGAAVNSLDYFMVSKVPVNKLIEQRELPVCPPVPDDKDDKIYFRAYRREHPTDAKRKGYNAPHNAAPFALTRWTNIYFTSDFVGGNMQRVFGKGVKDIPIARKSALLFPSGHTDYWTGGKDNAALQAIVSALRLSNVSDEPENDDIED